MGPSNVPQRKFQTLLNIVATKATWLGRFKAAQPTSRFQSDCFDAGSRRRILSVHAISESVQSDIAFRGEQPPLSATAALS